MRRAGANKATEPKITWKKKGKNKLKRNGEYLFVCGRDIKGERVDKNEETYKLEIFGETKTTHKK